MRIALSIVAVTVMSLPPHGLAFDYLDRDGGSACGTFRAVTFAGSRAHIRARVQRGPVKCQQARRVLRYAITHREGNDNNPFGSTPGWECARGGPGIRFTVEGYSCEARRPTRIVTGRYLY